MDLYEKLGHMDNRPEFNSSNHPLLEILYWHRPAKVLFPGGSYEVHCDGYKPSLDHVVHGNPRLVDYGHTGEHKKMESLEEGITVKELGSRTYNDWDLVFRPGFYLVSDESDKSTLSNEEVSYNAIKVLGRDREGRVYFSETGSNANPGGWKYISAKGPGNIEGLLQRKIYFSPESFS